MFLSDEGFEPDAIPARAPARAPTGFWEGLGAAWTAEAMETDAWSRRLRAERELFREGIIPALDATIGREELLERLGPPSWRFNMGGPAAIERAHWDRILGIAAEVAAENPDAFAGLPLTREDADRMLREQYVAEYQDAVQTLGYMQGWRGVTEFVGRGGAAITDPASLALGLVSGGSGSILRVLLTESALGAAGEAVVLPRQYEMAEYLDIEDPNAIAQIAAGAAFAGVLFGGGKVITRAGRAQISNELARATVYLRERLGRGTPQDIARETAVEETARAMEEGRPPPFILTPEMRAPAAPTGSAPLVLRPEDRITVEEGPRPWEDPDYRPYEPPPDVPDPTEAGFLAAIAEARRATAGRTRPLSTYFRRRGGIDPDGTIGQELRNAGITARTMPGLFSRRQGPARDMDNLSADEMEAEFPGIRDAAGVADDGLYLDPYGLASVLADELNGRPPRLRAGQELHDLETQLDEYLSLRDEAYGRIDPLPDTDDAGLLQEAFAEIRGQVERVITRMGLEDQVSPSMRDHMAQYLAEKGGRIGDLLDDMDAQELSFRTATQEPVDDYELAPYREADAAPWDDGPDGAELDGGRGGPGEAGPLPREPAGRGEGEGPDRGTGQGDAGRSGGVGAQTLIPGTDRVQTAQAQRAKAEMEARMIQSKMRRLDQTRVEDDASSLFADRAPDLFSDTSAKPVAEMSRIARDEMLASLETDGDFDVSIEGRTMPASRWLEDMAEEEDFVEIAELCGRTRGATE